MLDRDDLYDEFNRLSLKQTLLPKERQRLRELERMLAPIRPLPPKTQPVSQRFPKDHPILQIPTPKVQEDWENDPMWNLLSEEDRIRMKQIIHTTHQLEQKKDLETLSQLNHLQNPDLVEDLDQKEKRVVDTINYRKQQGEKMCDIMKDQQLYNEIIDILNKRKAREQLPYLEPEYNKKLGLYKNKN